MQQTPVASTDADVELTRFHARQCWGKPVRFQLGEGLFPMVQIVRDTGDVQVFEDDRVVACVDLTVSERGDGVIRGVSG